MALSCVSRPLVEVLFRQMTKFYSSDLVGETVGVSESHDERQIIRPSFLGEKSKPLVCLSIAIKHRSVI